MAVGLNLDNDTGAITHNGSPKAVINSLLPSQTVAGTYLKTDGAGVISWGSPGGGTVTNVATGAGLTGGPITNTGTVSMITGSNAQILVMNATGSPIWRTMGGDASIDNTGSVTIADDSHNHIISNVDGLQTALDGKSATGHTHTLSNITDVTGSPGEINLLDISARAPTAGWAIIADSSTAASWQAIPAGGETYFDASYAGSPPVAGGTNAMAIGQQALASTTDSLAIGYKAVAQTGTNPLAVGTDAVATGAYSISIGSGAAVSNNGPTASGNYSIAIAAGAASSGAESIAIGLNSIASNTGAIAIGASDGATHAATASGLYAIAIGSGNGTTTHAEASATGCIAIGFDAEATVQYSTAIGYGSTSSGSSSTSYGVYTTASGNWSCAIGGGDSSTSSGAQATGVGSIAIGGAYANNAQARATANYAIAIGTGGNIAGGASASQSGNIALGAFAIADRTDEFVFDAKGGNVAANVRHGHITSWLQTTTATPQSIHSLVYGVQYRAMTIECIITGAGTTTADFCHAIARFAINSPTSVPVVAGQSIDYIHRSNASMEVSAGISGNNILIRVASGVAATIHWSMTATYAEVR